MDDRVTSSELDNGEETGVTNRGPAWGRSSANHRQRLVEALLRGRPDEEVAVLAKRARHDFRVPHGVLAVCGFGEEGDIATAGRAVAGRIAGAVLAERLDALPPHAVIIVPVRAPQAWRFAIGVAEREATRHHRLILVRQPVTGLRALRASYCRAIADGRLALAVGAAGPVVLPDELVIPRMLALLDAADQRALVAPIRAILALAPHQRAAYLGTIATLRRTGGTQVSAAAALGLHVNSLRYRIDRIAEMTGLRFDDPADRLALDLAAMLVQLRGFPLPENGGDDFGLAVMDGQVAGRAVRSAVHRGAHTTNPPRRVGDHGGRVA